MLFSTLIALPLALVAPAATVTADDGLSFARITRAFETKRDLLLEDLDRQEFAALLAYVNKFASNDDANKARMKLVEMAAETEKWQVVIEQADTLMDDEAFATGAKFNKAAALAATNRLDEGRALMQEVADNAGQDLNLAVESWFALADMCVEANDIEAAEAAYESLNDAVQHPQIGQMVTQRIDELSLIGEAPTAIDVTAYDGDPLTLEQYQGKVVLIDFWATWCGPCIAELPNVLRAYEKYHDQGFEIIGVSLDDDEEAFKEFIANEGMTWRHYFDGQGWGNSVSQDFGVRSIPATYLLDKEGNIFRVGVRGPALDKAIAKALAQ